MEVMVVEGEISHCKPMKMFRIYEPFISRNTGRPEMENRGEEAIKTEKGRSLYSQGSFGDGSSPGRLGRNYLRTTSS